MAKDPAFLFYPGDWLGGTMGMTLEQKGAYIELLMLQFNVGHMTSDMIGQVVGQNWDKIKHKFKKDSKGLYWNERLEKEKKARKAYTESRKNNLKGSNQYTKKRGHKTLHKEDEDEDENRRLKLKIENEIVLPFQTDNFKTAWNDWKEYKSIEHNFKFKSPKTEQRSLIELQKLSNNIESEAIAMINRSISNNWKGFFKEKIQKNGQDRKTFKTVEDVGTAFAAFDKTIDTGGRSERG